MKNFLSTAILAFVAIFALIFLSAYAYIILLPAGYLLVVHFIFNLEKIDRSLVIVNFIVAAVILFFTAFLTFG